MNNTSINQTIADKIFSFAVKNRGRIIDIFKVAYGAIAITYVLGFKAIYFQEPTEFLFDDVALAAGRTALCLFIIILIPGMAERFGIKNKLISIIRIFRRYLGIGMYLLVLTHASFFRLIPIIQTGEITPFTLFELFGLSALTLLFPLFITSNDISINRLGIWWYRIQRCIYIAVFFIFFHVAFQSVSIWSVLMGITASLMMASFIYSYVKFGKMPYEK